MEQNQNRDFSRHTFNSIFSLTRHSSVFKSYLEIERTWPTTKCRRRNSFDTWYYIVICATLCVSFSSKCFSKSYSEIESTWSINPSKEEIVWSHDSKEFFSNVLRKFLIKIEGTCKRENKEQTPQLTLLYCGRTVRSSNRRCSIRKLFLKIS